MGIETVAIVAATVIAAGSAAYGAYSQSEAADEQAKLLDEQAAQEKAAAEAEAANIREKGRRTAAAQVATLAGSGVKLDDNGSGAAILDETDRLTEKDALAALTTGTNRARLLKGEASINRSRGDAALISGGLNVASTVVGSVGAYQRSTQNSRMADSIATRTTPKYTLLGGSGLKTDKSLI